MSFDNWYASFWSYKNKTVNLRFICVSMVISVVFAPLLHTLIMWLHHKQVFFFDNNDFAPIKCNWNAALCPWLFLSDCCDNLLIIVLPTSPQAFVLVSVCRHKVLRIQILCGQLLGSRASRTLECERCAAYQTEHIWTSRTVEPNNMGEPRSRVGVEQSGFSVRGMERMMLVCPPLPTAVFPITFVDSFTHSVSATETTRQHQVCLPSSSLIKLDHSFCFSFELADYSNNLAQDLEQV